MAQTNVPTVAYLTVVNDERTGWTGGLLLLNKGGRPVEFHCTLPVHPTRSHEILFGCTLRQHLISEVIGPLLIEKCRTPISLLCCNQPESLEINTPKLPPIALVREAFEQTLDGQVHQSPDDDQPEGIENESSSTNHPPASNQEPINSVGRNIESMKTLLLAGSRLLVSEQQVDRARAVIVQLADLPDTVEPFERIREAIQEAQSQIARTANSRITSAA